jgi:hypothetical protein
LLVKQILRKHLFAVQQIFARPAIPVAFRYTNRHELADISAERKLVVAAAHDEPERAGVAQRPGALLRRVLDYVQSDVIHRILRLYSE